MDSQGWKRPAYRRLGPLLSRKQVQRQLEQGVGQSAKRLELRRR
eukprot:COSAG01_NODE_40280_length_465_cov_3.243169_2_plen_43_part_01